MLIFLRERSSLSTRLFQEIFVSLFTKYSLNYEYTLRSVSTLKWKGNIESDALSTVP